MLQQKSILRIKILSVLLACVLSACSDLSAVRDWSDTSLEATQFNEVVATYADGAGEAAATITIVVV